jgi:hypothetical protein
MSEQVGISPCRHASFDHPELFSIILDYSYRLSTIRMTQPPNNIAEGANAN